MSESIFDLIVIGAGPGGYIAAERAGSLGKKTLLIEKEALGGVCLNKGCIPTKTLLHASKLYSQARNGARIGVIAEDIRFDLTAAMDHKQKTVETLKRGIAGQMKSHGVTVVEGSAQFAGKKTPGSGTGNYSVLVSEREYQAPKVIIATGSSPIIPPIPGADGPKVVTSTELLQIRELPRRLVIIGGGYIGMEFASFFATVGTEVTVVEMMDEIVPVMDRTFAALLRKSIRGITYELGARVEKIDGGTVTFSRAGATTSVEGDLILLSVGRRPNVDGIGLKEAGIDMDRSGIRVSDFLETNLPGVYAIGDVNGKSLLAHSASRMGEVAVAHMFDAPYPGETAGAESGTERFRRRMRYDAIPWVVFTAPEVAGCGLSEEDARESGREIKVAEIPMAASGRYLAEHPGERGFCKVITDATTGVILGVHMIGSGSSELIFGAAVMIESELRVKDVREIIFPHPTISEVMRDTIWAIQ
jgi:dihydrolipoamide dehydrogenase